MTTLNDLLHILLCSEDHEYDMMNIPTRDSSKCYYYLECDISEGESMPDHVKWNTISKKVTNSLGFQSEEETLEFVKEIVRISNKIKALSDGNNARLIFMKSIIG